MFNVLLKLVNVLIGWVGLDEGKSDDRANTVQLEWELGLSLAKSDELLKLFKFLIRRVGSDNGKSDDRAKSVQLELDLGLSHAKFESQSHFSVVGNH